MLRDKLPEAFSDHAFVYETLTLIEPVISSVITEPLAGLKTA